MAEDTNNLRNTLTQLQDQLRTSPNVSEETRSLLQDLADEIHALLNEPASAAPGQSRHTSIVARLGDAEREFEATHPTLAGIVGSIIDALGRMGI